MGRLIDRIVDGAQRTMADSRRRAVRAAVPAPADPLRAGPSAAADAVLDDPRDPLVDARIPRPMLTMARLSQWLSEGEEPRADVPTEVARLPLRFAHTATDSAGARMADEDPGPPARAGVHGVPDAALTPRAAAPSANFVAPTPPVRPAADAALVLDRAARDLPVAHAGPATWTVRPQPTPPPPFAALRSASPRADAVDAVLAGARVLPVSHAAAAKSAGAPATLDLPARPAMLPPRDGVEPLAGSAPRSAHADPAREPEVARQAPSARVARSFAAPARDEHAPAHRAAVPSRGQAPAGPELMPELMPQLMIDHLDIRVVSEPPPAPERRAPGPPAASRSDAWSPAARNYLGRWP